MIHSIVCYITTLKYPEINSIFESERIVGVGCWWRMKAEDEKSEDRD